MNNYILQMINSKLLSE